MDLQAKNRTRRVIRVLMVFVAAVLLVMALGIPVANNFIAHGIKKELEALPLPADTTLVESVSVAGKMNGSGVQYVAALLLHSELSQQELQNYYTALAGEEDSLTVTYRVEVQSGQTVAPADGAAAFTHPVTGAGYYILYTREGSRGGLLDLDVREY